LLFFGQNRKPRQPSMICRGNHAYQPEDLEYFERARFACWLVVNWRQTTAAFVLVSMSPWLVALSRGGGVLHNWWLTLLAAVAAALTLALVHNALCGWYYNRTLARNRIYQRQLKAETKRDLCLCGGVPWPLKSE